MQTKDFYSTHSYRQSLTKQKTGNALRIMTWNLARFNMMEDEKHPEIKSRMIDVINRNEPDIACSPKGAL